MACWLSRYCSTDCLVCVRGCACVCVCLRACVCVCVCVLVWVVVPCITSCKSVSVGGELFVELNDFLPLHWSVGEFLKWGFCDCNSDWEGSDWEGGRVIVILIGRVGNGDGVEVVTNRTTYWDEKGTEVLSFWQAFSLTRKKLCNLWSNSWSSLPGSYPLTIRLLIIYEPGREDHEFDPRLGNFFLVRWKKKWRLPTDYLLSIFFTFLPWLSSPEMVIRRLLERLL